MFNIEPTPWRDQPDVRRCPLEIPDEQLRLRDEVATQGPSVMVSDMIDVDETIVMVGKK